MSYIGQTLPADSFQGFTTDSFTGDGSATTFTLSKTPFNESALLVVINNVVQKPTTNFTVSGTTLTIVGTAVASGDVIYATHIGGALPIGQAASLDLNGASDQLILDADADTTISADTDDQIDFKAGGTDTMHIINGKVGIGTSSPSTNLHVFSTADNAPHLLLENFQNADTDDAAVIELYLNDETTGGIGDNTDVGVIRFTGDEKDGGTKETYAEIRGVAHDPGSGSSNRGNLSFFVQSAGSLNETMVLDETYVLINTTTSSNGQLQVVGDTTNSFRGYFANSTANYQNMRLYSDVGGTETETFRIENDGDVKNTNNSYGAISDERIKQDITDASSQWDDIKALKIKKYKRKDQVAAGLDITMIGVIAQDLEAAGMGGLVKESIPGSGEMRANSVFGTDEKNPSGENVKSVKYSVLYMKAVKALQEAMAKIETLETKVKALEDA